MGGQGWALQSHHQIAGGDQTRRSLQGLGGQRWLCLCCLEGGRFAGTPGMLRSRHIPWELCGKMGLCARCDLGTGWVLGAIPLLSGIPPLSPSFSSPFPFSFLPPFFPHSPSQHLSWTTHPHALETFQTQRLFQRHPRGPRGSSPPNQTQICSLYANMMCVDAEALLAHTASKQKHMAEPGRATASAESGALGRDFNQQRPKRVSHGHCQARFPRLWPWQGCSGGLREKNGGGNGGFCSAAEPKTTRTKSDRLRPKGRISAMFPFLVHCANALFHAKLKPSFLSWGPFNIL